MTIPSQRFVLQDYDLFAYDADIAPNVYRCGFGQVSEDTVLTDQVGLHLGAGPCFLIYSTAVPEDQEDASSPWPEGLKVSFHRFPCPSIIG